MNFGAPGIIDMIAALELADLDDEALANENARFKAIRPGRRPDMRAHHNHVGDADAA